MRQSPPAKRRKTSSIWFSGSDYFPFTSSKQRKILCYIFADLEATRESLPYNRAVCYKRTKKRTSQSLEILESGEWVKPRKKPRLRLRTERRHILRMVARVHGFRVKNMAPDLFTNSCSVKNLLTRWIALPPSESMFLTNDGKAIYRVNWLTCMSLYYDSVRAPPSTWAG